MGQEQEAAEALGMADSTRPAWAGDAGHWQRAWQYLVTMLLWLLLQLSYYCYDDDYYYINTTNLRQ